MGTPAETTASDFIVWQKKRLPNRLTRTKDIGRKGILHWRCEAVTLRQQSNHANKVFVLFRQRTLAIWRYAALRLTRH
jgi:hypothetical protein